MRRPISDRSRFGRPPLRDCVPARRLEDALNIIGARRFRRRRRDYHHGARSGYTHYDPPGTHDSPHCSLHTRLPNCLHGLFDLVLVHRHSGIGQATVHPSVDIVNFKIGPHSAHASPASSDRHLECLPNAIGDPFRIVGIDNQRIGKFLRRSRHLTDEQDTGLVDLRRNIFLCHEVHAVVHGTD